MKTPTSQSLTGFVKEYFLMAVGMMFYLSLIHI